MTSFAFLQNTDSSNGRKVSYLMSVVALFLDDEKLYEISGNYASALSEDENALTEVPKEEIDAPEIMSESETSAEVEPLVEMQKVEVVSETIVVETPVKMEQENSDESPKKPTEKVTYKQYKEVILLKFNRQYGTIISQISASK